MTPAGCEYGWTLLARRSADQAVCEGKPKERPERNRCVVDRNGTLGGGSCTGEEDTLGGESWTGVMDTLGGV